MITMFAIILYLIVGVAFEISNPRYLKVFNILLILLIVEVILEIAGIISLLGGIF